MSDCSGLEATLTTISTKVTELETLTKNRITTLERIIQQLTGRPPNQNDDRSGIQSRLANLERRMGKIEQQLSANNKPSNLEARIKALENYTRQASEAFTVINFALKDHFQSIKILNDSTNQLTLTEQQIIEAFKKLTKDQVKGVRR